MNGLLKYIVGFLISLATILFLISYFEEKYLAQEAPVSDVRETISLANGNAMAEEKIRAFLQMHPTPSREELHGIYEEINEILVLEQARSVTGNSNLKSAREARAMAAAEKNKAAAEEQAYIRKQEKYWCGKSITKMSISEIRDYFVFHLTNNTIRAITLLMIIVMPFSLAIRVYHQHIKYGDI